MKKIKNIFFIFTGIFFIILGIAGILLPVIPGLPFLFMGIIFIARGSKKFMKWIFYNKYFGEHIKKFRKMGMNLNIRNFTLFSIWISHSVAIYFFKPKLLKFLVIVLLIIMSWMLLSIKTYKKDKKININI